MQQRCEEGDPEREALQQQLQEQYCKATEFRQRERTTNNIVPSVSAPPQNPMPSIPYDRERSRGPPLQNFRFLPMAPGQTVTNKYQAPVDCNWPPHFDVNTQRGNHNNQRLFTGGYSRGPRLGPHGPPNSGTPGPPGPLPPPPPTGPPGPPLLLKYPWGREFNAWGPSGNYLLYPPQSFNQDDIEWGLYYPMQNYHYPDKCANAATWYRIPRWHSDWQWPLAQEYIVGRYYPHGYDQLR
jgi:hypothetical protein